MYLGTLPPYVQLMSTLRDKCSQVSLHYCHSSASMYYTEQKPKNKKQGRPGNEAREMLTSFSIHSLVTPMRVGKT